MCVKSIKTRELSTIKTDISSVFLQISVVRFDIAAARFIDDLLDEDKSWDPLTNNSWIKIIQ